MLRLRGHARVRGERRLLLDGIAVGDEVGDDLHLHLLLGLLLRARLLAREGRGHERGAPLGLPLALAEQVAQQLLVVVVAAVVVARDELRGAAALPQAELRRRLVGAREARAVREREEVADGLVEQPQLLGHVRRRAAHRRHRRRDLGGEHEVHRGRRRHQHGLRRKGGRDRHRGRGHRRGRDRCLGLGLEGEAAGEVGGLCAHLRRRLEHRHGGGGLGREGGHGRRHRRHHGRPGRRRHDRGRRRHRRGHNGRRRRGRERHRRRHGRHGRRGLRRERRGHLGLRRHLRLGLGLGARGVGLGLRGRLDVGGRLDLRRGGGARLGGSLELGLRRRLRRLRRRLGLVDGGGLGVDERDLVLELVLLEDHRRRRRGHGRGRLGDSVGEVAGRRGGIGSALGAVLGDLRAQPLERLLLLDEVELERLRLGVAAVAADRRGELLGGIAVLDGRGDGVRGGRGEARLAAGAHGVLELLLHGALRRLGLALLRLHGLDELAHGGRAAVGPARLALLDGLVRLRRRALPARGEVELLEVLLERARDDRERVVGVGLREASLHVVDEVAVHLERLALDLHLPLLRRLGLGRDVLELLAPRALHLGLVLLVLGLQRLELRAQLLHLLVLVGRLPHRVVELLARLLERLLQQRLGGLRLGRLLARELVGGGPLAQREVRRGDTALLLLVLEEIDLLGGLLAHGLGPIDHALDVLLLAQQQLVLGGERELRLATQALGGARARLGVLERLLALGQLAPQLLRLGRGDLGLLLGRRHLGAAARLHRGLLARESLHVGDAHNGVAQLLLLGVELVLVELVLREHGRRLLLGRRRLLGLLLRLLDEPRRLGALARRRRQLVGGEGVHARGVLAVLEEGLLVAGEHGREGGRLDGGVLRAAERPVGDEVALLVAHVDELLLVLRELELTLGEDARALLERLVVLGEVELGPREARLLGVELGAHLVQHVVLLDHVLLHPARVLLRVRARELGHGQVAADGRRRLGERRVEVALLLRLRHLELVDLPLQPGELLLVLRGGAAREVLEHLELLERGLVRLLRLLEPLHLLVARLLRGLALLGARALRLEQRVLLVELLDERADLRHLRRLLVVGLGERRVVLVLPRELRRLELAHARAQVLDLVVLPLPLEEELLLVLPAHLAHRVLALLERQRQLRAVLLGLALPLLRCVERGGEGRDRRHQRRLVARGVAPVGGVLRERVQLGAALLELRAELGLLRAQLLNGRAEQPPLAVHIGRVEVGRVHLLEVGVGGAAQLELARAPVQLGLLVVELRLLRLELRLLLGQLGAQLLLLLLRRPRASDLLVELRLPRLELCHQPEHALLGGLVRLGRARQLGALRLELRGDRLLLLGQGEGWG